MTDVDEGGDGGGDPACWSHLVDDEGAVVVDLTRLLGAEGDGVHWTLEPDSDLNANLVRLDPAHQMAEHVNDEVDVLVVALAGSGQVVLGGRRVSVRAGSVAHVPKGLARSIDAGPEGLIYLTIHRRRGPLTIGRG